MIYLLTAIGLSPGGSSTVHIYTQTIHTTTQNKQYIEQHKNYWRSADRALSLQVIPPCGCRLRVYDDTFMTAAELQVTVNSTPCRCVQNHKCVCKFGNF